MADTVPPGGRDRPSHPAAVGRVKVGAPDDPHYDPPIDVAFICTGNICRSPMAEGLLRARLEGIAPAVVVGSAGLLFDGRPAEPDTVKVMRKRGVDVSDHRARQISAELLAGASLILGMERRHVREVAVVDQDLWLRSFTLPEFVNLARIVGARHPGEPLRGWVEHIGSLRNASDYGYEDRASEIADPYGRSGRAYREAADTIAARIDELVALAWPTPEPGGDLAPTSPGGTHADRHRR